MSVRDLGFIKWTDKYGNLEDMKSQEFKSAVAEETAHYKTVFDAVPKELVKKWEMEFDKLPHKYDVYYTFQWLSYTIKVCAHNRLANTLVVESNNKIKKTIVGATAFGKTSSRLWYIKDTSDGNEQSSLFILDEHLDLIKEIKQVGEKAESTNSDIYYVLSKEKFWPNKVNKISNVLKITTLYEETEEKYILGISKPLNQNDIFIIRKSAIYHDIAIVNMDTIVWLAKGFGVKAPIDNKTIAYDRSFTTYGSEINYPHGLYLNDAFKYNNEYYFIFKNDTFDSLYIYKNNTWTVIQRPIVADIITLRETDLILIGYPNKPDRIMSISNKLTLTKQMEGPKYKLSTGNNPIPWFSIHPPSKKAKGIVICGYGSYGMSTRKIQQKLWIPWLEQGYQVVSLCVRGGSENGEMWWDDSRTAQRRYVGVDDFVRGTKYLQTKFGFDETNTIIYGRSAGGFLVTAAANKMLNNIGVVYACKPYTDVLRTVTNKKLTQVMQESEEFGYVVDDPVGFMAIAKISPYENVLDKPRRNPAVLLTGGFKDPEVELYMPVKFVKRLHDAGWKNAVVRIADEGHFTSTDAAYSEAHDAALCEHFLSINK